ncbi:molybdopterin molybdenumtransferase MoeA [bacterium]|nr:MAG: molybdopterin molybdenumtransferase MoeA [bacterium]
MISFSEAQEKILSSLEPLPSETVSITEALGRVLAEQVFAPRNLPPMDNSAMDGYAFCRSDAVGERAVLRVVDEIAAGHLFSGAVAEGEAVKIMTGAPIPPGADTVVPVEDTARLGAEVEILSLPRPGANVRKAGEDVSAGDQVLPPGIRIRPAEVGMLASLGRSFVKVHQRPKVAILATGDEIVEIDAPTEGFKIINSNSYGLSAQVLETGAIPVRLGIGRDDREGLLEILGNARTCDMVLTTGGVSMGDYDYTRDVLAEWGVDTKFWKVAVKPGKPVLFGMKGRVPVFGLPGNPVSAMVSFEQFVRPALRKLMGAQRLFRPVFKAILDERAERVKGRPDRIEFVRCRIERFGTRFKVVGLGKRSSGMLSTLVEANGLLILPVGREVIEPGEEVDVQVYDYEFLEGRAAGW